MPSYNDERGVAVLFNNLNATLDSVYYSDKWHYPLLTDVEGVSLERLSIDRSSLDSTNWHSAAATVRYATPGYINSQITETGTPVQTISIVPETFSPDEDGYNDVVTILYKFEQAGYTANMQVYNSQGQLVQYLLRNTLISNSGYVSWDGINIANEKAPIGIYIIYTEVFDEKGNIKK
ncbi:MAG: gliding motility-associated C-terminal domain-containing protein [Bacteroidetes bacterium]|nr:gliding motility-associated C-terminal domain-containing protein [Bacteroidota bacterium]